MNSDLQNLRKNYSLASLNIEDLDTSPFKQFSKWFDEALIAQVLEPNAMILGTLGIDGCPNSRAVLLKGMDENGFVFYTNYESEKGKEIANNPNVSLNFLWLELERQVRIRGVASKISRVESEQYVHSRPVESQFGAWASAQSEVIADRSVIENKLVELWDKFKALEKIPLPDFWGGYIVRPFQLEFWQGRESRLHDRMRYTLSENGHWKIERLSP